MKIIEHIEKRQGTLFSFEILPPLKGVGIQSIFDGIDPLMEFNPSFIDVTYHREDFLLKQRADGSFDRVSTRKRPGTVAICAAIQNKYHIDAVPHIICGGFTRDDTETALIELNFLGIDNVLALRGDARKGDVNFIPENRGNKNALDLIHQVKNMNSGIYLDEELTNATESDFCIGAACYPEKHMDAPNLQSDLKFLKRKVEAGAEFLVTQMFFDNQHYFDFVQKCRDIGINVPIIPGIKPISTKKQLMVLPKIFHIDMPEELVNQVEKCSNNEEIKQVGIEWTTKQCKELMAQDVPVLHFYTMGKAYQTKEICKNIF
ncbi:methylenetetrahydrofolate reductase [NAD(P)H] [Bacteroidia bacterium]|nr:methylenetetrahydrofolate reductase [NAD(P)H] [Bacteroidia bacterium]MDA9213741.1 methylenetetrahydrofolate reductase [NAD(P)H] [Bacteroidia bacterium]